MSIGRCSDCGATVIWSRTNHGKAIPLNPQPVQVAMGEPTEDDAEVTVRRAYAIHFSTCAKRAQGSRR